MSVTVVLNILFTLSYPESRNNLAKIEASPRLMFRVFSMQLLKRISAVFAALLRPVNHLCTHTNVLFIISHFYSNIDKPY